VLVAVLASALAIALCTAALRLLKPSRLGSVCLVVLGVAASLIAGATGSLPHAVALPVLVGGVALVLARRRKRRNGDCPASQAERQLRWLAASLSPGLPIAILVAANPEWNMDTAATGARLAGLLLGIVLLGLLPLAAAGLLDMRGSVEWFIAVRYLVARRRQVFISAITAICVGGIAAGVWLIVIVLSVMNGFQVTWREEILGNRAHFTVHSGLGPFVDYEPVLEQIRAVEGVTAASPYVDAEGLVRGSDGQIFSVRVRGIDPVTVGDVTDLRSDLIMGSLEPLESDGGGSRATAEERRAGGDPGIVIGNQLAVSVGVGVGDELLLISPFGGPPTPLGPAPRLKRFSVVGVFRSSFFQYDEIYTYVSIPAAQDFRGSEDVVDGIEARTTDFYRSRAVGTAVTDALGFPFFTRDWKDFFPAFFQALKTERIMMFLLLTMIIMVAAFLIVATLIMMIMEKSSDIAILKAMGAGDDTIERIFALQGTLIGLVGTVIGVVAGIAVTQQLTWLQDRIEAITGIDTLPASVYQFSTLPYRLDPVQIALVGTIAMVFSLGATLLPSHQGARIDPAEGLRHE